MHREHRFRRMSPRALSISPHHRAIWDIRPFAFDPETMEVLIHECPVCNRPLIWKRIRGICYCPYCVDANGRPSVDLREFPQPLIETDDRAALLLAPRLLSHDEAVRRETIAQLPAPWTELSAGELFSTLLVTLKALRSNAEEVKVSERRESEVADIGSVPYLIQASRMMLEGTRGLAETLRKTREGRTVTNGIGGRNAELGSFFSMRKNVYLSTSVRDIFDRAIIAETAERPITYNWDRLFADGRTSLSAIKKKHKIGIPRLMKLIDGGFVPHVRGGYRTGSVRVFPEDIEPILEHAKGCKSRTEMAGYLGVSGSCVETLARVGQIERATEAVSALYGSDGPGYVADSGDYLLERIEEHSSIGIRGKSVMAILESSPDHVGRLGIALVILAAKGVEYTWWPSSDLHWEEAIQIEDADGFLNLMTLFLNSDVRFDLPDEATDTGVLAADNDLVGCADAAKILDTNTFIVGGLGREGFLPRMPGGVTLFRRADVERLRDDHIFGRGMRRAMSGATTRAIKRFCSEHGLAKSIQMESKSALIYSRRQFEGALASSRR